MSSIPTKRVILDKSFLQAESSDGQRLALLRDCGALFVLTDTLIYELCTDVKTTQWPATQRKLFPIADNIEVWRHMAELLRLEIADQRPMQSPVDQDATARVREWFKGGKIYVPPNLKNLGQAAYQEREVKTVAALQQTCLDFCQRLPSDYIARIRKGGDEASALLNDLMARDEFIQWRVRNDHGNEKDAELYIRGAKQGLGPEWFAHQHAKATQALCCHYMSKYGLKNFPGKDLAHTKLDAEYVMLLHYADALATNETSGSLSDICSWMHGDSKIIFSTEKLDKVIPKEDNIRVAAYHKWELDGKTYGHDHDDWYWAKADLLWRRLANSSLHVKLMSRTDGKQKV